MLKNYWTVAWRNLWRNKTYSSLNILGLSVGMAVAVLIMLWVVDELTFDRFHTKIDRIFRLHQHQRYDGQMFTFYSMPPVLALNLKENFPEIKRVIRTNWGDEAMLSVGEKRFYEQGLAVDTTFFEVFSFPLAEGDLKEALVKPNSIVISQEVAKKFFGDAEAIGQLLKYNNRDAFEVTGVLEKMPPNSTLKFEFLIPYHTFMKYSPWLDETNWGNNNTPMYIELAEGTSISTLNKKIRDVLKKHQDPDGTGNRPILFGFPLAKERLYGLWEEGKNVGGRIDYVQWFSVLAFFVLFIACVNFMNLSTARAGRRSREIGIRKAVGAERGRIMSQFLGESILMSSLALLIAVGLVLILLPGFNALTEKELRFHFWSPQMAGILLAAALLTGLFAGSYPAIYMSGFHIIQTLKGVFKSGNSAVLFRKGLVVIQFSLCAILVIGSILVYQQIQHIQNRSLGYDRANVLRVWLRGDIGERFDPVNTELSAIPGVESVAASGNGITQIGSSTYNLNWPGKKPKDQILFSNTAVDPGFLKTYRIELVEGRDFQKGNLNDTLSIIFNELAIKRMGLKDPLGQTIDLWDNKVKIIGVTKDFHFNSIHSQIEPFFFTFNPKWRSLASLKLDGSQPVTATISAIEQVFKKHNPAYPFEYDFVDKDFNELYKSEQLIGKLARVFSFLAIFVACLGLFGLAAFSAEQRVKEIGVRKVLGATLGNIVLL
ncbi:MAG: ABC transporter permease, partial [Haliscomenobacter sp.]|uniref:ABC transporter permease n=1 Tax=Haliscomenobacter sp. TaxID=2717303 RepID=UPI0029ADD01D